MNQQRKNIIECKAALLADWGKADGFPTLRAPIPADLPDAVAEDRELPGEWNALAQDERALYRKGLGVTMAKEAKLLFHRWRSQDGSTDPGFSLLTRSGEFRASAFDWLDWMTGKGGFGRRFDNPVRIELDLSFYPHRTRIKEPCFFLGSHLNWGHWLSDCAINLIHLDNFKELSGRKLVLGETRPFHAELLEAFGIPEERCLKFAPQDVDFCSLDVDDLAVPLRPPLKAGFAYLRQRLAQHFGQPAKGGAERVYLTRGKMTPRHRVFNEEAVANLLKSQGFEILDVAGLSLKETMAALGSARIIVSPVGAGMGNYLLANPEAVIVNLFPRYLGERSIQNDHYTNWTMTYHFPFSERMLIVLGDFCFPEQLEYAALNGLEGLDLPFHYELRDIDLALLKAEKMWMQRKLR